MQFEVIRKNHKKEVMIGVVAIILIAVVLLVRNSFAKYQTVKNLKIAEGTINYTIPDFKVMAMYKNDGNGDIPIDTMPESGYKINTEKSYCTTDNVNKVYNKVFTNEEGKHVIKGLSKNSKCYIYFDKMPTAEEAILGDITVPDSKNSFSGPTTKNEGIFKAQDDDGYTYYYRGAITNNYVKFAGFYWRIIRINGDGSIRLIYQGTVKDSTVINAQIGISLFNSNYDSNMYVGFQYKSGDVHGYGSGATNSTILNKLNAWYEINLQNYDDKIDVDAGFCNDREPSTNETESNGIAGTGSIKTYYGAYIRLVSTYQTYQAPTFKCKNSSDLFTKNSSSKGNKALKNPIGLITADEVVYAGGYYGTGNQSYYLYTGQSYWTISPFSSSSLADVFYVWTGGGLGTDRVSNENSNNGVRPVINLRSDTKFSYKNESTKGTMDDPYVVQ